LRDVDVHGRRAFANDTDPQLPADVAKHVHAVIGLSSVAAPGPSTITETAAVETIAGGLFVGSVIGLIYRTFTYFFGPPTPPTFNVPQVTIPQSAFDAVIKKLIDLANVIPQIPSSSVLPRSVAFARGATGVGQKIGVVAFSDFQTSDVADYLAL